MPLVLAVLLAQYPPEAPPVQPTNPRPVRVLWCYRVA